MYRSKLLAPDILVITDETYKYPIITYTTFPIINVKKSLVFRLHISLAGLCKQILAIFKLRQYTQHTNDSDESEWYL